MSIVKDLCERNLPGGGNGTPSVNEPHRMLVTDGNGRKAWQERTHYADLKYEFMEYGSVTITEEAKWSDGSYGMWGSHEDILYEMLDYLKVDQPCKIEVNGRMFTTTMCQFGEQKAVGNPAVLYEGYEDNGMPFAFVDTEDGWVYCFRAPGEYIVGVYAGAYEYHQLPKEYLSEDVLQPDYNTFDPSAVGFIKNRPCYYDGVFIDNEESHTVPNVGMGGDIAHNLHTHEFKPGYRYHVVGEIGIKYASYETANVSIDLYATAQASVIFGHPGLSLNKKIYVPANNNLYVQLESLTSYLENPKYESYNCSLRGYWFYNTYVKSAQISIEYIRLHCYVVKQLDEVMIPDTIQRAEDNVVIPAGKTLTIQEGATVNDEAGALGGGWDAVIEWDNGEDWNAALPEYNQLDRFADSTGLYDILWPKLRAGEMPKILLHCKWGRGGVDWIDGREGESLHTYYTPISVVQDNWEENYDVVCVNVLYQKATNDFSMKCIRIKPSGIDSVVNVTITPEHST